MKKIDFNKSLLNFDDEPLKEQEYNRNNELIRDEEIKLNKLLANNLAQSQKGTPLKMMDWAKSIYKTGIVIVDNTDSDFIKTFITEEKISNLVKAQLLECVDKAEEVKLD